MKISCQSCQAKYTIADEKVLGKVVKIRCKKCSSTIVINGNDAGALAANEPMNSMSPGSPVTDLWTVNVAEGDQRTLSTEEVVSEFGSGVIHDETFCWREGMDDWLPLREIDELREAVGAAAPAHHDEHAHDPHAGSADEHTMLDNGGSLGALFGGPTAPTNDAPAAGGLDAGHLFGDAGTGETAARRSKGRGVGGTDLFGGVSQAGGEDESTRLAAPAFPSADNDDVKLTGQRNESSVLFSLNALTSQEPNVQSSAAASASTTTEGSGLIDIRALSASANAKDKPASSPKVDDIMNLSGGGAFGAALAAPVLAAPSYSESSSEGGGGKSNKMIFAILGGFALVAVAAFGAILMVSGKSKTDGEGATTSVGAAPSAGTPTTAAATPSDPAAAPAASAAAPAAAPATPAPKAPTVGAAPPVVGGGSTGGGHSNAAAPAKPAEPEPPAPAPTPPPPKDLAAALGEAAGQKPKAPPPAAATTDAPFDRGAAAAALGNINVQSCKKPDGPTGQGRVKVTFAPSGSVQSAAIEGAPFEGTPVGSCVAGKFRGAHIPAFAGSPVTAGKSFNIN